MKVYLIKSSSYRLLNLELDKLLQDVDNITKFSLMDVSIFDCIEDASYYGLFSGRRGIVIKDVNFFGGKSAYEKESEAILKFLESKDDSIIIFVCDEILKSKDLTKKVIASGAEVIDLSVMDEAKFNEIANEYIKSVDVTLDKDAYILLKNNTLSNIDLFIQEIDKMSNFDKHITKSIIETCGFKNYNDSNFDFSNAVVAKNFKSAFDIMDRILASGVKVNDLVGLLANSFINMYMVKDALAHHLSDTEICKILGYSNPYRLNAVSRNAKIYTLDELKDIIIMLCDLDQKIKTGYNPVYGLKEFLINL